MHELKELLNTQAVIKANAPTQTVPIGDKGIVSSFIVSGDIIHFSITAAIFSKLGRSLLSSFQH
jgi:hypothetical protein